MKKVLLTGMMLCLTASMALAAGLNINWVTNTAGNCAAIATANMSWDCLAPGANTGEKTFVISVMPSIALVGLNAMDIVLDIQSDAPLQPWWMAFEDGTCRQTAFVLGLPPPAPLTPCTGSSTTKLWSAGDPAGGYGAWTVTGNRARTVIGYGSGTDRALPLVTTTQYNALHMDIQMSNSLDVAGDPGDPDNGIDPIEEVIACDGCDQPVTLVLQQLGLYGGTSAEDIITTPGTWTTSGGAKQVITWQGGGTNPPIPVSTRNTTWGQVKSLYR